MTRSFVAGTGLVSLLLVAAAAAQRPRLDSNCRAEVRSQCGGAAANLRRCLAAALPKLSDECRKAIGTRTADLPAGAREYAYGQDPGQRLDLVVPAGTGRRPLLLFIHGGGWSIGDKSQTEATKAQHFNAQGWAFGSVNYRLVPKATVEDQAADIAAAIAYVRAHSAELGVDPDRIVLMGHSAGAHLAALVGSDTAYLSRAGVPLRAITGIVLLDGAGYDIARQMAEPGNPVAGMYEAAFGRDPARQRALSPTFHAAAPNAGKWLILPVADRADSVDQSRGLATSLKASGSRAVVTPVPSSSHAQLNRRLRTDGDFATRQVDSFLAALRLLRRD